MAWRADVNTPRILADAYGRLADLARGTTEDDGDDHDDKIFCVNTNAVALVDNVGTEKEGLLVDDDDQSAKDDEGGGDEEVDKDSDDLSDGGVRLKGMISSMAREENTTAVASTGVANTPISRRREILEDGEQASFIGIFM